MTQISFDPLDYALVVGSDGTDKAAHDYAKREREATGVLVANLPGGDTAARGLMEKVARKAKRTTREGYVFHPYDSRPHCPDCGKIGERKGHMDCEYPS